MQQEELFDAEADPLGAYFIGAFYGGAMRPLRRSGVNKHRSARSFRGQTRRTQKRNMAAPMRGGIRL